MVFILILPKGFKLAPKSQIPDEVKQKNIKLDTKNVKWNKGMDKGKEIK